MNTSLTDKQHQMQAAARERIEAEGGVELARRAVDGEDGVAEMVWELLAAGDFQALPLPASYGGLDDSFPSLGAILKVLGRYAVPAPYAETVTVLAPVLERLGTESQREHFLPAIADGDLRASLALHDDRSAHLPGSVRMETDDDGDDVVLNGTKPLVPYGGSVDEVLVATRPESASDWGGISLLLVEAGEAEATRLDSLDGTRPMYSLAFDDVRVPPARQLGDSTTAGPALRAAMDSYRLAGCFQLVGGAERAVDRSVDHASDRRQYGYPVGMYQGVKHRIAEMYRDVTQAEQLAYYAAWALEQDDSDARRAVSAATAFAAPRCRRIFEDDIKNHGGRGFTWDYDGHLYLKRAKAWEAMFGWTEHHLERIAAERGYGEPRS